MSDEHQLDLVHRAIRAGVMGNIEWKDSASILIKDDPKMIALTAHGIRRSLREFVIGGGCLEVRREARAEYLDSDDPFWYRARVPLEDYPQPLFIEVKLIEDDPDEPFVLIVSSHF